MRKLKFFCFAVLVACLAVPVAAQDATKKKGDNGNNGAGEPHGQARAEEVQTANGKGDKDNTPSKGSKSKGKKTRTREGWEKSAKHHGPK